MTSYTKSYKNTENPKWLAIKDIREYLGEDVFNKVEKELRKVKNYENFKIVCMIGGIEGYPVEAWYDLLHGEINRVESTNKEGVPTKENLKESEN